MDEPKSVCQNCVSRHCDCTDRSGGKFTIGQKVLHLPTGKTVYFQTYGPGGKMVYCKKSRATNSGVVYCRASSLEAIPRFVCGCGNSHCNGCGYNVDKDGKRV